MQDMGDEVSAVEALRRWAHWPRPSETTVAELLRHGTLGIGALADAGDEVVVVDRQAVRLRSDGTASPADDADRVPFAMTTTFSPDLAMTVGSVGSRAALEELIDDALPPGDFVVAVHATGRFGRVCTGVGPVQTVEHRTTTGSLVGFRAPRSSGVQGADHHLVFLDTAQRHGGSLVDFDDFSGRVELGFSTAARLSTAPRTEP
ncbi:acetolactate decarboxylase [Curtobacterium sp. PhB115]|nr:acetolactate decarboxylase [Curtobacterium sp. PhB115]